MRRAARWEQGSLVNTDHDAPKYILLLNGTHLEGSCPQEAELARRCLHVEDRVDDAQSEVQQCHVVHLACGDLDQDTKDLVEWAGG